MDGILANRRYVNLSKVDDITLNGESLVSNRVVELSTLVSSILSQVATSNLANYYSKTEVNDLIANRAGFEIVQSLPTTNISPNKIYLVAIQNDDDNTDTDSYDEYIRINNNWEHVGSFQADFSAYSTTTEVQTMLNNTLQTLQGDFAALQLNFTALQNHVGNIDDVLDAINGEVV